MTDGTGVSLLEVLKSHDPVIMMLAFLLTVVVVGVGIAKPLMALAKEYKSNSADNSRSEAESALYKNLQMQIENNTEAINRLNQERDEWFRKALSLEKEVERLSVFEQTVSELNAQLREKSGQLSDRESEIRSLMSTMTEFRERIHELEIRLSKDEASRCLTCEYRIEWQGTNRADSLKEQ